MVENYRWFSGVTRTQGDEVGSSPRRGLARAAAGWQRTTKRQTREGGEEESGKIERDRGDKREKEREREEKDRRGEDGETMSWVSFAAP